MNRRVFVLGLDGATLDIIRPMVEAGKLPAFTRMMNEGSWGPLESVASQRSAAAWSTFMTGMNPGKHGIYEFYDYLPETYNLKFINGAARHGASLWRILSRAGRRVGVINVPMTYPAEEVNGVLVAGLDCPSVRSPGFTHPASLAAELEAQFGAYMIEPGLTGAVVGGKTAEAVDLVRREFNQKMAVTRSLMKSRPWDFFMTVLRSLDAVQHTFWKYSDPRHPDHNASLGGQCGSVISDTYEMIDGFLGELLDELDDGGTYLMVMSDHGFGRKHPATGQINAWLASRGYLRFRRTGESADGILRTIYRKVVGLTSRRTKEWLWEKFPSLRDRVHSRLCFANIDWSGTRAYSDSLFANVRINLRGREGEGTVAPGEEQRELTEELAAELAELQDRRSGEPIVEKVLKREDLYNGPFAGKAPELLIRWRENVSISGIRIEGGTGGVAAAPPIPGEDHRFISGDHHLYGVLFMRGPGVEEGRRLSGARITDLAPTILYQSDLPIPADMDGNVLMDAFTPRFRDAYKPATGAAPTSGSTPRKDPGYDTDEEAAIRSRLRDLGYVE